jgi:hypothetical protein
MHAAAAALESFAFVAIVEPQFTGINGGVVGKTKRPERGRTAEFKDTVAVGGTPLQAIVETGRLTVLTKTGAAVGGWPLADMETTTALEVLARLGAAVGTTPVATRAACAPPATVSRNTGQIDGVPLGAFFQMAAVPSLLTAST